MEKLTKGILIGSGVAAVSTAAMIGITQLTSNYLIRVAMDRGGVPSFDKRMDKLTGNVKG